MSEDTTKTVAQMLDEIREEMRAGFAAVNARLDRLISRLDHMIGDMASECHSQNNVTGSGNNRRACFTKLSTPCL
jgi:hypothetical protein